MHSYSRYQWHSNLKTSLDRKNFFLFCYINKTKRSLQTGMYISGHSIWMIRQTHTRCDELDNDNVNYLQNIINGLLIEEKQIYRLRNIKRQKTTGEYRQTSRDIRTRLISWYPTQMSTHDGDRALADLGITSSYKHYNAKLVEATVNYFRGFFRYSKAASEIKDEESHSQ